MSSVLSSFTGICADIAVSKHEHWSSFAPLPFEVIISAGQKAKEESWDGVSLLLALYYRLCLLDLYSLTR